MLKPSLNNKYIHTYIPVFNASQTPGGCSLNEILAKGINSMNNLVQILIR